MNWTFITRLGEAQILLPAALLVALLWAMQRDGRTAALCWLAGIALATGLTTATKVAFLGWGIGSARWDFTGISGHTMYAASIYPVVLAVCLQGLLGRGRWAGAALGSLLALVVGVSRLVVHAHSPSEVLAGLALGGAVSAWALAIGHWHPRNWWQGLQWATPLLLMCWVVGSMNWAPPPTTHALVTRLSLKLSGRDRPYTRADLQRVPLRSARESMTA